MLEELIVAFCREKTWKVWGWVVAVGAVCFVGGALLWPMYGGNSETCVSVEKTRGKQSFWLLVGVTSKGRKERVDAVMSTWGKDEANNMVWYGDEKDSPSPLIKVWRHLRVPKYEDAARKGSEKEGYKFMTHKMQAIWSDLWKRAKEEQQGPAWYVRFWDDNYLFVRSFVGELALYNPDMPLLVGHRHATVTQFAFPDGGNTWAVSRAALLAFGPKIHACAEEELSEERARAILGPKEHPWCNCKDPANPGLWCAEDIFLWHCMQRAGVKFLHFRGISGLNPGSIPQDVFARSVLGNGGFPEMMLPCTSQDYYSALHPVDPKNMKAYWTAEKIVRNGSAAKRASKEKQLWERIIKG